MFCYAEIATRKLNKYKCEIVGYLKARRPPKRPEYENEYVQMKMGWVGFRTQDPWYVPLYIARHLWA